MLFGEGSETCVPPVTVGSGAASARRLPPESAQTESLQTRRRTQNIRPLYAQRQHSITYATNKLYFTRCTNKQSYFSSKKTSAESSSDVKANKTARN